MSKAVNSHHSTHASHRSQPNLSPLVVSAPFGNYVHSEWTTSTLGTYTLHSRPGRMIRVLKTVRYSFVTRAWVNRIGLRNPGISALESDVQTGKVTIGDRILSIHGISESEWFELVDRSASLEPLALELNLSCPNVGEVSWPADLFRRAVATGVPVIAKLPPILYQRMVSAAVADGVQTLHCCNTLPVPQGGLSGKPLKPISLECIRWIREWESQESLDTRLRIIGGGGITRPADIDDYADAGADVFAIGTKAMNPALLFHTRPIRKLIEHAAMRTSLTVGSAP